MTPQGWIGLTVCLIIIIAIGTTILVMDAWGNLHPRWVDKQIKKMEARSKWD